MDFLLVRGLFDYWKSLPSMEGIPGRHSIHIKDIPSDVLPYAFLLDVNSINKDIKFRLAGTGLCALYGAEMTGSRFMDLWDSGPGTDSILLMIRRIVNTGESILITSETNTHYNNIFNSRSSMECLLMPLRDNEDKVTRILGCMVPRNPLKNVFSGDGSTVINQEIKEVELYDREGLVDGTPTPVQQPDALPSYLRVVK